MFFHLSCRHIDFFFESGSGQPLSALSHDDHLFQSVGSCYCNLIFPADRMDGLFDKHIGCFCLFCIDHMDIVIFCDLLPVSFHTVSIKYQDQRTLAIPLIIAQNIFQAVSRTVNVDL